MPPTLTRADAAHFVRRIGFGGSLAEIDQYSGLTRDIAVARALDMSRAPAVVRPPVIDSTKSSYEGWQTLLYWWFDRMATTPTPLQEKLTLFWHGHFATQIDKVLNPRLMWDQHQVARAGAFGSFRNLCREIALGPAMLIFLDNVTNTVGKPQENFARELMELHTIGVGNFSESDVVAMARAWTGHGLTSATDAPPSYLFDPARHDAELKTLFGITRAWNGPETIDELVLGAKRNECAQFIARKLARFFVSPAPSDALVLSSAAEFVRSGMRIDALVRFLLLSDEFWSPASRYSLVKSPIEFCACILRITRLAMADSGLHFSLSAMGQTPFNPPDVAGWGTGEYWVTTSGAWGRGQWLNFVRWGTAPGGFLAGLSGANPSDGAQRVLDAFGLVDASAATASRIERWIAAMRAAGTAWALDADAVVACGMAPEMNLA